jgi:hypothetical protein
VSPTRTRRGSADATQVRTGTRGGPVTDAEYRALAQFRRGLRSFLHFSEEAAYAAGVTPSQHQLLLAVRGADPDHPPTIGQVADWLNFATTPRSNWSTAPSEAHS